jgi:hypothetical protein
VSDGRAILRPLLSGVLVVLVLCGAGVAAAAFLRPAPDPSPEAERAMATGAGDEEIALDGVRPAAPAGRGAAPPVEGPAAKAPEVIGVGTGQFSDGATAAGVEDVDGPPDPGEAEVASDAEIRSELADFRDHIEGVDPRKGARAYIDEDGRAVLPEGAPRRVALVVAAANEIATKPYKWGGGHGPWKDSGYDCSGSVSFALAGAKLLDSPLNSSGFLEYGDAGEGEWITIHTNPGHMFMTVAGLRFDTSGQDRAGTRWQRDPRPTTGLKQRHPPGL